MTQQVKHHPEMEDYYVPVFRGKPPAPEVKAPAPIEKPILESDRPDSMFAMIMVAAILLSGVAFFWVWTSSDRQQISQLRQQKEQAEQRAQQAETELQRINACITGGQ